MAQRKHADLWNKLVDEAGEDEIERAASLSVEQAEAELKAAGFDVAAERAKASSFLEALENGTVDHVASARSAPGASSSGKAPRTAVAPASARTSPSAEEASAARSCAAAPAGSATEQPPRASAASSAAASSASTQPVPLPRVTRPARRPAFAWLAAAASFGAVVGGSLVAALEPSVVATPPPHTASDADRAAAAELRHRAATACDAREWSACLANLDKARAADPDGDDDPAVKTLRDKALAGILK